VQRLRPLDQATRRGELTLTGSKPNFVKAAGGAVNVSEATSTSHQPFHVASSS
jgi:hypothetical protein